MAELDLTYRCNFRCRMCRRWALPWGGELSAAEYEDLAASLHAMGTHQVTIGGGEPLLREDLFLIVESFSKRGMSVNICTNGILIDRYLEEICSCGATCITVSLDGATSGTHDDARGVQGAHRRIEDGITRLLERPSSSRPIVRVRMTISGHNVREMRLFNNKWSEIVDDVLFQPVHSCREAYYSGVDAAADLDPRVIFEQIDGGPMGKDAYMRRLIESLENERSFPRHRCYAAVLMVRIDPWGNIFPCLEQHTRVGSIRREGFRTIWNSEAMSRERDKLASRRDCRCWYNNTALIGHYGSLLEKTGMRRLCSLGLKGKRT